MHENVAPHDAIRDTLFGDLPLAAWASHAGSGEPWTSFGQAQERITSGDESGAVRILTAIAAMEGLESRHYLQAWHTQRELGVEVPKDHAKTIYGVVVEVTLDQGPDVLAAYADHSARYFNYSGAGVVWDHANDSFDELIDRVLEAGRTIVARIGPWTEARPPTPPAGQARLSMLTPSGLHFGQGPLSVLAGDPLAGPLLAAATELMRQLVELATHKR